MPLNPAFVHFVAAGISSGGFAPATTRAPTGAPLDPISSSANRYISTSALIPTTKPRYLEKIWSLHTPAYPQIAQTILCSSYPQICDGYFYHVVVKQTSATTKTKIRLCLRMYQKLGLRYLYLVGTAKLG